MGVQQEYEQALANKDGKNAVKILQQNPQYKFQLINSATTTGGYTLVHICASKNLLPEITYLLQQPELNIAAKDTNRGRVAYVNAEENLKSSIEEPAIYGEEFKNNANKIALALAVPTFKAACAKNDVEVVKKVVSYGRINSNLIKEAAITANQQNNKILAGELVKLAITQTEKEKTSALKQNEINRVEAYINRVEQTANYIAATGGKFAPPPQIQTIKAPGNQNPPVKFTSNTVRT